MGMAETESRKATWAESLSGRFYDSVRSGPIDYDALELLLHQERMKAARLHAQEQQKMEAERKTGSGAALVEGFSIANIALSAQRGAAAADSHARQEEKDERYSHADSQDEIDTLLSAGGRVLRVVKQGMTGGELLRRRASSSLRARVKLEARRSFSSSSCGLDRVRGA